MPPPAPTAKGAALPARAAGRRQPPARRPLQPPPAPPAPPLPKPAVQGNRRAPEVAPPDPAGIPAVPSLAELLGESADAPTLKTPSDKRAPEMGVQSAFDAAFNELAEHLLDGTSDGTSSGADTNELIDKLVAATEAKHQQELDAMTPEEREAAFNELAEELDALEKAAELEDAELAAGTETKPKTQSNASARAARPDTAPPAEPPPYAVTPPPYDASAAAKDAAGTQAQPANKKLKVPGDTDPLKDKTLGEAVLGAAGDEMMALLGKSPAPGLMGRLAGFFSKPSDETEAFHDIVLKKLIPSVNELQFNHDGGKAAKGGQLAQDARREQAQFVEDQLVQTLKQSLSRLSPAARARAMTRLQAGSDPTRKRLEHSRQESLNFLRKHRDALPIAAESLRQAVFTQTVMLNAMARVGKGDPAA